MQLGLRVGVGFDCDLQNDDTYGYCWFEDKYLEYLRVNHQGLLEGVEVDGVQVPVLPPAVEAIEQKSDRKLEMMEMKVQISNLKIEIRNLKLEIKELKNGGLNKAFVLGNALVVVVMLNLFVTLLVAAVWK